MEEIKITATFNFNEQQWETARALAKIEPGWTHCDLDIRIDGKQRRFEADFLRPLFEAIRISEQADKASTERMTTKDNREASLYILAPILRELHSKYRVMRANALNLSSEDVILDLEELLETKE